jgi:hypothetical protein
MMSAAFKSGTEGTIYRLLADNATVVALAQEIGTDCSSFLADLNIAPIGNASVPSQAQPEQALQYYRASSVVLTLDGYNNSAMFESEGTPDTQLPDNIDIILLDCINNTVGNAAPLVDPESRRPVRWTWFGIMLGVLLGLAVLLLLVYLCIHGACFALCLIC